LSFKPDTENNTNFDAVSSKRANFDKYIFFIKHTPKLIIFGTHNLRTFKHNTLTNKVLLLQFLPRDASAECGYEIACRPSVRLSVRNV